MTTFPQHQPSQLNSNDQSDLAAPASYPVATAPISRSTSHAGSVQHQSYNNPHVQHLDTDHATRINTISNTGPSTDTVGPRGGKFTEEWDASQRGSSIMEGHPGAAQAAHSYAGSIVPSEAGDQHTIGLSRGNTLKKKASVRRTGSLRRSGSRRSMHAGSVKSLALQSSNDPDEMHSAFHCPVPTTGNPTEALANRFQAWRKILKDLITYFREIQAHYESRSKSLLKLGNALNSTQMPPGFLPNGGLDDALQILRNHNKHAILEAAKAREIEEDVILALTGLRSDLNQKIKEIKNLSGDFKNSVEREMAATRRAVDALQEVLGQTEHDAALTTGKQDPYLLRLAVDRQLERQIDEENYLHQAYLNLETSGRELEAIVVGEIQKSYNAYAGILKRDADAAYIAIDQLRNGPIAMPKDHEWSYFISRDDQFVDPDLPLRSAEYIHYPGRDHYACQEVRAGLLERKSKYLKSYTAGWYVLSPTHLHEFKSADKTQAPVMSLYLPEQKLGSHSTEGHGSNKFILKGRQTGGMHRGHTWVFRAESHDTMMAWYEDIKALTEKSPEERSNFVRGHVRSLSRSSQRSTRSMSSDGHVDDDDDDEPPFAATAESVQAHQAIQQPHNQPRQEDAAARRPEPGGRFPSDLQVNAQRGLQVPVSPSSVSSGSTRHGREQHHQPDHDNQQDQHAYHQQPPPQQVQQREYHQQQAYQQQQPQRQQPKPQGEHHDHHSEHYQQQDTQQYQKSSGTDYHEDDARDQQPAHQYNEDPNDAVRQAAALPGVAMLGTQPQHQPYSAGPDRRSYGSTERTPMNEATSHAAVVSAGAIEDGVNPYTNEPVQERGQLNRDTGYFPDSGQAADSARPGPERRLSSRAEGTGLMVVGLEEEQRGQSDVHTPQQQSYHRAHSDLTETGSYNRTGTEDHVHGQQGNTQTFLTGVPGVPINKPYIPHQRTYQRDGAPDLPEEQQRTPQSEHGQNEETGEARILGTTTYSARPSEGQDTSYPVRPAEATRKHSEAPTVSTISHLHVPGEYPKGNHV